MNTRRTAIASAPIAALLALGLSACGPIGPGTDSSTDASASTEGSASGATAADCVDVQAALTRAQEILAESTPVDASGLQSYDDLANAFGEAADAANSPEVKAAAEEVEVQVLKYKDLVSQLIAGDLSAAADFTSGMNDLTGAFAELGSVCSIDASATLEDAGSLLEDAGKLAQQAEELAQRFQ